MSWIIYFFGSGLAFYVGVAMQLLGAVAAWRWRGKWSSRAIALLVVLGLLLVVLSATPLPYWLYALAIAVSLVWLIGERWQALAKARTWLGASVIAVWMAALILEVPFLFGPDVPPLGRPRLVVVGDSVAAGGGEAGVTAWPKLLVRDHDLDVLDLSRPGAKVRSAIRLIQKQNLTENDLLLLLIGGNDVLGGTGAADFEQGLDELLALVSGSDRVVLMFELPMPPFCNAYALTQRRLAARHGVRLIPKYVLVNVLTSAGGTSDSIHFTPAGHARMAEAVWQVLRPAYGP